MKRIFYIFLFLFAFLFYWNTALRIENRTEAEDAYAYAAMVETEGHSWLYHPHHLLHGSLMKAGYSGLQSLGWNGRAFDFLMLISSLSAAGTLLLFFQFCYRRFSLRPVSSLLATGLLAVSYGFWRYAAEAEVVLPASFLGLAALYCATGLDHHSRRMVGLGVLLSVLAVLMHIMNAVVVFVAIPCFYLLRRRWGATAAHLLLGCGGVAAVFCWFYSAGLMNESVGGSFLPVGFGSFVKAMIALGQCVVSGNFLLGFVSIRAFLSELFASRMLMEEFYLGARLARSVVLFSTLTFLILGSLVIGALWRAGWVWKNLIHERARIHLPEGLPAIAVVAIWFFGYAGLLLCVEPGNPELWVMGLTPFWLLICGLVLLPLTVDNRLWLPFAALLFLLVHNGVSGIGVLGDPGKDYQHQKAKWILEHATSNDVVVTAGNPVFERYLRYHFEGAVIYLHKKLPDLDGLAAPAGRVFVLGDVFNQVESLRIRFPKQTDDIAVYAEKLKPEVELIDDDEFGGVFLLNNEY